MQISEWLPNPVGTDSAEWVEIFNGGTQAANLSVWKLKTANGKTAALSGNISPGEYKLFTKSATGLTLRNTDESLTLLNPAGIVADQSSFRGTAVEGQSVIHEGKMSFFGEPTPGAANALHASSLINDPHPIGMPLNPSHEAAQFIGGMFGTAVVLTALVIYILKNDADLSELFFGRN